MQLNSPPTFIGLHGVFPENIDYLSNIGSGNGPWYFRIHHQLSLPIRGKVMPSQKTLTTQSGGGIAMLRILQVSSSLICPILFATSVVTQTMTLAAAAAP